MPVDDSPNATTTRPLAPEEALRSWRRNLPEGPYELQPIVVGLINRTWSVGTPPKFVLQQVNPLFDRRIQGNFAAVTEHLHRLGLPTPRLLETDDGELWAPDPTGFWRLMTYVPGRSFDHVGSPSLAMAAGELVGRFHAAMRGSDLELQGTGRRIHDTPQRLAEMRLALESCDGHPLAEPARELGRHILDAWERWEGELDLPEMLCHGDLKVSNLRFDSSRDEGLCLLDLDTLGALDLSCEMGDAWRSWCNRGAEDEPEAAHFDFELFAASARGWRRSVGELERTELDSLVPGIERICLELASRFCRDVVTNDYFREDRQRFPSPGEHNLLRTRSQLRLAVSARSRRADCSRVLGASL